VIVGDVTFDEIKTLSEKYFAPIERGPLPREMRTVEPEQLGEKRTIVTRDVPSPYIMISYHVPQTNSEEYYALSLLESILSSGKTSRLYSSLIDENQLAIDLGTDYSYAFDPYLFTVYAICSKGVSPESVEIAILKEIDKIIKEGITLDELQKVKNQKLMKFYHTMETINGKANTIGSYELFFGDYKKLFSAPQDFAKVTAEDVQKVAQKYFTKKNRTVGILMAEEEIK